MMISGALTYDYICSLLGEQLRTFAALAGVLCHSIVVDELSTCLKSKVFGHVFPVVETLSHSL